MDLAIYLLLGIASFLFVVVPISGAFVLNPLLSLVTDPHSAVSIGAFFFFLNSATKAVIFRRDIKMEYVRKTLPLSLLAAPFGAALIGYISPDILLIIIFLFALYFLFKKTFEFFSETPVPKKSGKLEISLMSILTGFMQGTGLGAGGSLRKMFLFSENLTIAEMNGTASMIGIWILAVSVATRLVTKQVAFSQLIPILYLIPVMFLATWLGRKFLKKLTARASSILIMVVMVVVCASVGLKILNLV